MTKPLVANPTFNLALLLTTIIVCGILLFP